MKKKLIKILLDSRRTASVVSFTGILDTITDSVVAYSFRKLKSTATNSCELRRSSDDATTNVVLADIGGLTLSSEVSAGGTLSTWVGSNSAYIRTKYDQSGNSNDAIQTTTTKQALIINAGVLQVSNSLAASKFDGTDDVMSATNSASLQITGDMSAYIVMEPLLSDAGQRQIIIKRIDDNDREFEFRMKSSETRYLDDNNSIGYTRTNSTIQYLQSFDRTANTNVTMYANASNSGSQTLTGTNTVSTANLDIGARAVSSTDYFNGYIQEIILFNANKSSDRTAITNDINTFYSIY